MAIEQKFQKKPTLEMTLKILLTFGLKGFNEEKTFTKKDMNELKTLEKITEMTDELKTFYIPCKRKALFDNLDTKRCLTILRHFLKHNGHYLDYYETMKNGKKIMIYKIITLEKQKLKILRKKVSQNQDMKFIVSFS